MKEGTSTESEAKEQRTFSNIKATLELAGFPAQVPLALVPIRRPNLDEGHAVRFACPDGHEQPTKVTQFYRCADGHEHIESELGRIREVDDETSVALDKEEVETVRCGDLESQQMALSVHPAAEVEAATVHDNTAYRCRINRKASKGESDSYALLRSMAADPEIAIVGSLRMRGSRSFYRLIIHRGQLSAVSLVLPQDLAPIDVIDVPELPAEKIAAARSMIEVTPFDPAAFYHDATAAMAELVATKDPATPVTVTATAKPVGDTDLMAALEASIEAGKVVKMRKPRKAAAKKAPAKRASRTG